MKRGKMLGKALQYVSMLIVVFICVAACSDYDNTKATDDARDYYQTENMLIEASTLKAWIDNGYKTENGNRVVVVNANTGGGFIPGSVTYPDGLAGGMNRSDGPGVVGNQVYDGATMDKNLRATGIDKDTVIVITGNWASSIPNQVTRMWWVHYYWGFSETKLKVLNGGNQAYAATGATMASATTPLTMPSTFSVKDLPGNRIDLVRAPFGDVLKDARNSVFERKEKLMVSTLATGTCFGAGNTAPCIPNSGSVFRGRIHGGIQITSQSGANALYETAAAGGYVVYKSAADLAQLYIDNDTNASFLPADKNFRIITHCGSGQSTTVANFALIGILGYKNVANYDGSLSEWGTFSAYRYDSAFGGATPTFVVNGGTDYVQWSKGVGFFADRNGTKITDNSIILLTASNMLGYITWDTSTISDYMQFTSSVTAASLTPLYEGDGREINEEDKKYQQGNTGGGSAGGGSQGGGAGAGC